MHTPAEPVQPKKAKKRPLTDAEFFGVAPLEKEVVITEADVSRPEWYLDWLDDEKLKADFVLWHDAQLAWAIFILCQFQWLHGFNGVTGLNYASVIPVIALHAKRQSDQLALLEDIHALELGAMTAFADQRKRADEQAEQDRRRKGQ
jgi:hypothetical protein